MERKKATQILLRHCGEATDNDPLGEDADSESLLLSLRPYCGLREELFHDCLQASYLVCDEIVRTKSVEPKLVSIIWRMCSLLRHWGLHPEGMLRRNNLIKFEDISRLGNWVDCLEMLFLQCLYGKPAYYQVDHYCSYVADYECAENLQFFFPYIHDFLNDENCARVPNEVVRALAAAGPAAGEFLPKLRQLYDRRYSWFAPEDRCTEETKAAIGDAIAKITKT